MKRITGRLAVDMLQNGVVQMQFSPNDLNGTAAQLGAQNLSDAEEDLVRTFEFTVEKAKAQIAELQKTGHIELVISIDEGTVPRLFRRRTEGAAKKG